MAGYSKKQRAVAEVADCKPSELTLETYETYGLETYSYGRSEYIVGDDDEADEAVIDYIRDSLWAFNAGFMADQTELPIEVFEALSERSEDANEALLIIVEKLVDGGIEEFAKEAVRYDGRGHFISGYDGAENEAVIKGETFYVYRVN